MDRKILLLFSLFGMILVFSIYDTYAVFSGTHTLYENKSTAVAFCTKCHQDKVLFVNASVHSNAGCLCHGYNPNNNDLYNLNVAHNLTKQIYCTNCHSNYSIATGEITIHFDPVRGGNISGINQSAHYIINSSVNKIPLYDRAKNFFNGS